MISGCRLPSLLVVLTLVLAGAKGVRADVKHRLEVTASEARLDGVRLVRATTVPRLVRALGEPSRREKVDGFELALWDADGIVVRHRGAAVHEVSLVLRSQRLALPGGEELDDPAEPTATYDGSVQIGGAPLPASVADLAPRGMKCRAGRGNHRCSLGHGVILHVSPERGAAELVVVRVR